VPSTDKVGKLKVSSINVSSVLVLGLLTCILAALPSTQLTIERFTLPKEVVLHIFAAVAGASLIVRWNNGHFDRLDWGMILIAFLGIVSAVFARNRFEGLRSAALFSSGTAIFLAGRLLDDRGRRLVVVSICFVGAVIAGSVIIDAHGGLGWIASTGRPPGGIIGNRNNAAHLIVLTLPVLWVVIETTNRSILRCTLFLITAMSSYAVVLTRSRAAWLAGIAIVLAILVLAAVIHDRSSQNRSYAFLASIIVGASAGMFSSTVLHFRSSYADTAARMFDYQSGTGRGRLIQYSNTLRMARDHLWLGVGPRNWQNYYPQYASTADPSYNPHETIAPVNALPQSDWFGFLAERGVVAFLLLGSIAATVSRNSWRSAQSDKEGVGSSALLFFLLCLLILGTLDTILMLPAGQYLVALTIATLYRPESSAEFFGRRSVVVVAAALALIAAYSATENLKRIRARQWSGSWYGEWFYLPRLERALALDPGSVEIRLLLARELVERGRCQMAAQHLAILERLNPHLRMTTELRQECRSTQKQNG
jgi:O-antigen ligase